MKSVIISADDFGLTESINKGIIQAYKEGAVSSASLMVNMPGFEDAVSLIKDNHGLDIGLHVNIYRGKPVLQEGRIRSLIDENGFFLQDIFKIAKGIYQKSINFSELESECDAQIRRALDRGINITHLDSEKHLHLIGPLYKVIVRLMKKYGIHKIRNINEGLYLAKFIFNQKIDPGLSLCKTIILQFLSMRRKKFNLKNSIKTTDYSFGLYETGDMVLDKYEKVLKSLQDGVTEIFCHPGYCDTPCGKPSSVSGRFYPKMNRRAELDALLSPRLKEMMDRLGIGLITYKTL